MSAFIALYRGINVGGRNRVKMDLLRAMHERLGHHEVRSYIQSGNIIFAADGVADAMASKTAAAFVKEFGFAAKVVVIGAKGWKTMVSGNPYARVAAAHPHTVHAGICQGEPSAEGLKELLARAGGGETFKIKAGLVYVHAPNGFGSSKFAAGMEKACGVPMTVRNWRTIEAIWKMVGGEI